MVLLEMQLGQRHYFSDVCAGCSPQATAKYVVNAVTDTCELD